MTNDTLTELEKFAKLVESLTKTQQNILDRIDVDELNKKREKLSLPPSILSILSSKENKQ